MRNHYEHRHQPLLPRAEYYLRVMRHGLAALGVLVTALLVGILGYHFLGQLSWLDALVNASMILGGMGPVNAVTTVAGKWFISLYALFAGIVFLFAFSIVLAPVVHRFLHHFHLETDSQKKE